MRPISIQVIGLLESQLLYLRHFVDLVYLRFSMRLIVLLSRRFSCGEVGLPAVLREERDAGEVIKTF
jgi:hypothetical protein